MRQEAVMNSFEILLRHLRDGTEENQTPQPISLAFGPGLKSGVPTVRLQRSVDTVSYHLNTAYIFSKHFSLMTMITIITIIITFVLIP
jgi:hypothetical protein